MKLAIVGSRTMGEEFYELLEKNVPNGVDVYKRQSEGYHVERALKEKGIPVLGLETDYTDQDEAQLRTRIGAFLEMLGE